MSKPHFSLSSTSSSAQSRSRPGLRSADTATYMKPCIRTKFGECGFRSTGPAAWNSLPEELQHIMDTDLCKCRLKIVLFSRTYCH